MTNSTNKTLQRGLSSLNPDGGVAKITNMAIVLENTSTGTPIITTLKKGETNE